VTGLGGHALGSFRSIDRSKVWLRDFLPEDIPTSRVLVYGYNTKVERSTDKSSIHDLAKSFLESLKAFRVETKVRGNPT